MKLSKEYEVSQGRPCDITFADSVSIWNKIISGVTSNNDGINGPMIIDQPEINYLPEIICDTVYDGVINFNVSPMYILLQIIGAMCCAARGYFHVHNGMFKQIANIFLIQCARSGYGKSHINDFYKNTILSYECDYNESIKHIIERERVERDALKERIKKLKKKSPNPSNKDKYEAYIEELMALQAKIDEMKTTELVMFADNVSPAGLLQLLSAQNERIAIMTPEFGILKKLINANSNSDLCDKLIRAFNGDSIKSDLATQDPIYLKNPIISICIATQPYILKSFLMNEMISKSGMGARLLVHISDDRNIGFRRYKDATPDAHVNDNYSNKIKEILDRVQKGGQKFETLHLDSESKKLCREIRNDIESQLQDEKPLHEVQEWGAKACMHITSIAAFVHLFENSYSDTISINSFRAGLNITDWLAKNFISFKRYTNPENTKEIAKSICEKLIHKSIHAFSERDVQRFFSDIKIEIIRPAISLLEMHGAITMQQTYRNGPGRPSKLYVVNNIAINSIQYRLSR